MKLKDSAKLVCVAILEISRKKRYKIFIEPGASETEINKYFADRKRMAPPDLSNILQDLASGEPKVLEAATYGGRGPFYQVRF